MLACLDIQVAERPSHGFCIADFCPRMPDYMSINVTASRIPGLGQLIPAPFSAGVNITVTRNLHLFVGPEIGVGSNSGYQGDIRAGWIDQSRVPSERELDNFASGWGVTGSVYVPIFDEPVGVSGAETWGNPGHSGWHNFGTEVGVGVGDDPGAMIDVNYDWQIHP
jgi:hypothetical protein